MDWDSQALSLRRVLDAVAATGFVPIPLSGGTASALRREERRQAFKRIGLAGLGMMQTMMLIYGCNAVTQISAYFADFYRVAWLFAILAVISGANFALMPSLVA